MPPTVLVLSLDRGRRGHPTTHLSGPKCRTGCTFLICPGAPGHQKFQKLGKACAVVTLFAPGYTLRFSSGLDGLPPRRGPGGLRVRERTRGTRGYPRGPWSRESRRSLSPGCEPGPPTTALPGSTCLRRATHSELRVPRRRGPRRRRG